MAEADADKASQAITEIIIGLSAEDLSDVVAGLMGVVQMRAKDEQGHDHSIYLMDALSTFSSKLHIEARQAKARDEAANKVVPWPEGKPRKHVFGKGYVND